MSVIQLASLMVNLEGQDKGFSKMLNQADKKVTSTAKNIGKLGSALTKTLTAGTTAAITGLVALQKQTGEYADTLLDLSDATGVTTDTLQRWRNVERSVGIETDRIAESSKELGERLAQVQSGTGPAAEAFSQLGVSLFDSEGEMKGMSSIIPELLQGLGNIENATERNIMGTRVFGESWSELAPVIALGGEEFNKLAGEADNLGTVMSKESLEAADKFRQEFVQLQAQLASVGRELAIDLMPMMKDTFIPMIKDLVSEGAEWITWLGEVEKSTGLVSTAIKTLIGASVIGPLLIMVPKIVAGTKLIVSGIKGVVGVLKLLTTQMIKTAAIVLAKVLAVTAVIGSIVLAFEYVRRNSSAFADFFGRLWIQIQNFVVDAVANMVDGLGMMMSWIPGLEGPVAGLSSVIRGLKQEVPDKSDMTEFQGAGEFFGEVLDDMKGGFNSLMDLLPSFREEVDETADTVDGLNQSVSDIDIGRSTQEVQGATLSPPPVSDTSRADLSSFNPVTVPTPEDGSDEDPYGNLKASMHEILPLQDRIRNGAWSVQTAVTQAAQQMAVDFAAGVGEMLSSGASFSDLGRGILTSLADLAIKVGKIAISTGIAIGGIKKALQTLNPVVAIAAGAALVALGTAAKGALSSAASGGGNGGSGGGESDETSRIVRNLSGGDGSGRGEGNVTFEIQYDKLVGVLDNGNKRRSRV